MAIRRLRRGEQVEQNRERLLLAARRVFLRRGFHAATLEQIAEEAGFSKGVVYSQFESKADLFLALLERRIADRAAQNERAVREAATPAAGLAALVSLAERLAMAEPEWALLLIEFRVHAAREPALNERYARLHALTVARLARLLAELRTSPQKNGASDEAPEDLATFLLALGGGLSLERAVSPAALGTAALEALVGRALGISGTPVSPRAAVEGPPATVVPGARRRRGL